MRSVAWMYSTAIPGMATNQVTISINQRPPEKLQEIRQHYNISETPLTPLTKELKDLVSASLNWAKQHKTKESLEQAIDQLIDTALAYEESEK